jgi:leucyl-tRNA---protein transferase
LARQLRHFIAEPSTCAYLPDREAALEYRLMIDVSPEELDVLLERGWRRFGPAYFRPKCKACSECVPLRIPISSFRPSRQQRRAWNKCKHFRFELRAPVIDDERLRLYKGWHAMQSAARGWTPESITEEDYYHQFAFPHPSVRELAYYDEEKLICVSIIDETPTSLSAVYTYHHPDYRNLSLGTFAILFQVELAKQAQKKFVYLGYRVLGCRSSEYKAHFKPHEILVGWPELDQIPRWTRIFDNRGPER